MRRGEDLEGGPSEQREGGLGGSPGMDGRGGKEGRGGTVLDIRFSFWISRSDSIAKLDIQSNFGYP